MSQLQPPSPGANNANHNLQHARQLQQRHDEVRELQNSRSPINILATDESAIAARKEAVRNSALVGSGLLANPRLRISPMMIVKVIAHARMTTKTATKECVSLSSEHYTAK